MYTPVHKLQCYNGIAKINIIIEMGDILMLHIPFT